MKTNIGPLTAFSTALIFITGYLTMQTIDENLQRRPVREIIETATAGSDTELVFEAIKEIEDEIQDTEDTRENGGKAVCESDETLQSSVQEIPETSAEDSRECEVDYSSAVPLAQTLWGECGSGTKTEQAAVVWCVLNRVDDPAFPDTIIEVVSAPKQFQGYSPYNPVDDDHLALCEDVLARWYAERDGAVEVGRVLPKEYCFFEGDGYHNYFVTTWKGTDFWTWTLPSPYER